MIPMTTSNSTSVNADDLRARRDMVLLPSVRSAWSPFPHSAEPDLSADYSRMCACCMQRLNLTAESANSFRWATPSCRPVSQAIPAPSPLTRQRTQPADRCRRAVSCGKAARSMVRPPRGTPGLVVPVRRQNDDLGVVVRQQQVNFECMLVDRRSVQELRVAVHVE